MSELLPALCILSVISNTVQKTLCCIKEHTEFVTNHTVSILKVHPPSCKTYLRLFNIIIFGGKKKSRNGGFSLFFVTEQSIPTQGVGSSEHSSVSDPLTFEAGD